MCGRTGNVCISRDIRNKMDIKKHGILTKRIKKINCQPCKNNRLTIKRGYVMLAISSASVSDYPGSGTAAPVLDGWNRGCGEKFMYMCENRMASDA